MFLARLLGLMVSCQDMVAWACFRLRPLQKLLRPYTKQIRRKLHTRVFLPATLRVCLDWWLVLGRLTQGLSLDLPIRLVLTMDASLLKCVGGSSG